MRLFRRRFDRHDFHAWDESAVEMFAEILVRLRRSRGDEVANYSGVAPTAPDQDISFGAAMDALSRWCRDAFQFAENVMKDGTLEFTRFAIISVAEPTLVELFATLSSDFDGMESVISFGEAVIERTGKSSFRLFLTPRTRWNEWLDNEARIAKTPLEELLASGEVEIANDRSGWFATEGKAGKTFYEKKPDSGAD